MQYKNANQIKINFFYCEDVKKYDIQTVCRQSEYHLQEMIHLSKPHDSHKGLINTSDHVQFP